MAASLARHVPAASHLTLALSGGLDSVALLHAVSALRASHPFALDAVHVHHGLSPRADDWTRFCERICDALGVRLVVHRVRIAADDPAGIEAAARRARRQIFADLASDFLLTAHHQDDQAETLLLQLLRGAGPKGLAGMAEVHRAAGWRAAQLRPLLAVSRRALRDYAQTHALEWVEDESNADPRFRRNALRVDVLPVIEKHFPGAAGTLARAASLQAEAAGLLDELSALDARGACHDGRLDCAVLRTLPPARARNLLRAFIASQGWPQPPARRLEEAVHQLRHAGPGAGVGVALGPMTLHRYRDEAYLVPARTSTLEPARRCWQGEPDIRLVEIGKAVRFTPAVGAGLSRARLEAGRVEVGVRSGRESLRLSPGGPHRTLRNLMQESAIPPWERARAPLVFWNDQLVWADGIGVDADFRAAPGEAGVVPEASPIEAG